MAAIVHAPQIETLADLMERLGNVPMRRIRFRPFPGTARAENVVRIDAREERLYELADGVLVVKPKGDPASATAIALASQLCEFVIPRNLGIVTGDRA